MLRLSIAFIAFVLFSLTAAAHALEIKPYSDTELKSAQSAGKPIVLWFHASWCSTCRRQEKSLGELAKDRTLDPVIVFDVDFDNSEDLQKSVKVNRQSSMVAFKGSTEVGRSVGVTREGDLTELFKKTL